MRIRVTTKRETFELRKQQHTELGYRIEDEQLVPVNGLCSFIAVKEDPVPEILDFGAHP
ncbi:MAG TPA: hypothetical protein VEV41_19010 [Terriglobales bacterium]|nr:hypothetical protein [Terriglobales bacterium]